MKYLSDIQSARNAPQQLEALYRATLDEEEDVAAFSADMMACYLAEPDNLLFQAWYYRLGSAVQPAVQEKAASSASLWKLAIPFSLLNGLLIWLISADYLNFTPVGGLGTTTPYILVFWAPLTALVAIAFLAAASGRAVRRSAISAGILLLVGLFVLLAGNRYQYPELMMAHLPLLAWGTVALSLLGLSSSTSERFAFLTKTIEVGVTAGVLAVVSVAFLVMTQGLATTLNISLPPTVIRLLVAGVLGLIPVIAVNTVYDPQRSPAGQDIYRGVGKIVPVIMRLMLPLTILVLLVYTVAIPFHFMEPFQNRDVLIVYNILLFAVIGLIIGVTPPDLNHLSPRMSHLLRTGILVLTGLAILVSLYAMSATIYRTIHGALTMNRLAILGWNTINIGLLASILFTQFKKPRTEDWTDGLQTVLSTGIVIYLGWCLVLTLVTPWLF